TRRAERGSVCAPKALPVWQAATRYTRVRKGIARGPWYRLRIRLIVRAPTLVVDHGRSPSWVTSTKRGNGRLFVSLSFVFGMYGLMNDSVGACRPWQTAKKRHSRRSDAFRRVPWMESFRTLTALQQANEASGGLHDQVASTCP